MSQSLPMTVSPCAAAKVRDVADPLLTDDVRHHAGHQDDHEHDEEQQHSGTPPRRHVDRRVSRS
jgi:hypothetical protein